MGAPLKRVLLAAAIAFASGCAGPMASLKERSSVQSELGPFVFEYAPRDAQTIHQIQRAVERAAVKLSSWGQIRDPIHVRVMPNHQLLEAAVNRPGYEWLRAWAKYDEIFLQSPRTWGLFGGTQDQIDELVLHELTHSVMYQASATKDAWRTKQIPLWFREGMASYSARQGYRWATLEDLARFYAENPKDDPVNAPEDLYKTKSDWVYSAAHHAFTFLVRRYGEDRIRAVMRVMREGKEFPAAFKQVIGIDAKRFAIEFKRYVRLRAFRGSARRHPDPPTHAPR